MTPHYARRKAADRRFRWYGMAAVALALGLLVLLLGAIVASGVGGLREAALRLEVDTRPLQGLSAEQRERYNYRALLKQTLVKEFPQWNTPQQQREILRLASIGATYQLRNAVLDAGERTDRMTVTVAAADAVNLYLKGKLTEDMRAARLSDLQVAAIGTLQKKGMLALQFDREFFTTGDSREPELAGFLASIVGSVFSILACLAVAFPIGVMAAIYLEEFAKKGWFSDVIEVNINNLAAVPSIVFGLLGLAVYLNFFGLPRSSALVGGLTLALMTLPVIIIATRAALRAVPPSIRDAARGLGASEIQVVMHHTLPLALPGIMTGTILGVARAIGETAPLLMIGMVAFIADVPASIADPATAMPVQIYLWASSPEISFIEKTAAGIMVLLAILLTLNLLAVWLRNKFERKW